MNKDMHLYFVDISKAFDNVKYKKFVKALENTQTQNVKNSGIDRKNVLLLMICIRAKSQK